MTHLPLSDRIQAALTLAYQARRSDNWGRTVSARNKLEAFLRDPHPLVRRIAEPFRAQAERVVA